jgi:hypothetical protein
MADTFVSSRELVEEIWRRVATGRDARLESPLREPPSFRQLNHDFERHYINAHCLLDRQASEVPSVRPLATLKQRAKRRAAAFTMAVLERYFNSEEDFLSHLIRFQNNIAEGHDQLAHEVTSFHQASRAEFERLRERIALLQDSLEQRIGALEQASAVTEPASPA